MSDIVFGCFVCIAFVVIVLFNVRCFTPDWILMEETDMTNNTTVNSTNATSISTFSRFCHHGLLYSKDSPNSEKVFDWTLIGVNVAASVCFTVIPMFWCCIICLNCCGSDSDESCADGCCSCYSFFYVVGGLLGLVSSIMVISKFDTSLLGWSFYLTVTAIAIVLLQTAILLAYCIHSRKTRERFSVFMVYRRRHYNHI